MINEILEQLKHLSQQELELLSRNIEHELKVKEYKERLNKLLYTHQKNTIISLKRKRSL